MGFDVQNFGIGLLTGWASAYAIYRARHFLSGMMRSAGEQAASAQNYATRSADSRYINDLLQDCEKTHLGGAFFKLSDVVIEPRFIAAPPLAGTDEDDVVQDAFYVVPRVHDQPYLHAPYNLETLSIDDLATGDRTLALLGLPGSGRTTALLTIAMHSLNRVRFKAPVDKVQQRLDTEEARLSEKERAVRIKERVLIEQRAKERLADEKGVTFDADENEESHAAVPLFHRLMPVYVHLADMSLSASEFGAEIDPAEPLVRAVQYRVGRVTASTLPRNLYNRLNRGQILLLIDGYDDLPEAERVEKLAWLSAFLDQYRQNFIIIAGPVCGCGPLLRLGITPVYLRPWSDLDSARAAENYAGVWQRLTPKRRRNAAPPDESQIELAKTNSRTVSPVDLSIKLWSLYLNDAELPGLEGWMRAYLARHLPADMPLGALLPSMAQMAALQLDEGYITRARLEALTPGGAGESLLNTLQEDAPGAKARPKRVRRVRGGAKPAEDGEGEEAESTSEQGRLLIALRRAGLLVRHKDDRYRFRHAALAAYLASLTLRDAPPDALASRAMLPEWELVFAYAALHTPIDAAVQVRLNAAPDVLHNHLFTAARWLAYAGADAAWRPNVLKSLGTMLAAPNQFPLLRERAAAALVGARDTKNVLLIFRRAVRNTNTDVRRLACLGMGALGEAEGIRDLVPLLRDQDAHVQLAAGLGLGAIGTEAALEAMVTNFTEGSEQMRQAMAEAFAAMPEEGYPILFDAINDAEMMLRRAAVFGLRRIRTNWALIAIYRAFLEDDQWYVRSAAQQAFQEMQFGRSVSLTTGYPPPESIGWLAEWAAARGENVPTGDGAQQMLLRALQEGEPKIRQLAASALGQLGAVMNTRALYTALRDRQDEVRVAAHRALADLQMQIGQPLPAPA